MSKKRTLVDFRTLDPAAFQNDAKQFPNWFDVMHTADVEDFVFRLLQYTGEFIGQASNIEQYEAWVPNAEMLATMTPQMTSTMFTIRMAYANGEKRTVTFDFNTDRNSLHTPPTLH